MQIEQKQWTEEAGWHAFSALSEGTKPQFVLAFGGTAIFRDGALIKEVAEMYPDAIVAGSTPTKQPETTASDGGQRPTTNSQRSTAKKDHLDVGCCASVVGCSIQVLDPQQLPNVGNRILGADLVPHTLEHALLVDQKG